MDVSYIQKPFCQLAHYNIFVLKFCPTMYNYATGIGLLLFLQLAVAFMSGYIFSDIILPGFTVINIFTGAIFSAGVFAFIRFFVRLLQNMRNYVAYIITVFLAVIIAVILAVNICLLIFIPNLEIHILLDLQTLKAAGPGRMMQLADAMITLLGNDKESSALYWLGTAVILFTVVFVILPYTLIFFSKRSIYYKTLNTYEKYCKRSKIV